MYKLSNIVSECGCHQPLKCGWSITVSHLYDSALKRAEYCGECGFAHILRLYVCLLISLCHVQFGPEFSTRNVMPNCVLFREQCHIFPCVVVLLSQIEYGAQCTIFLWDTKHRGCLFIHCWYPPSCCGVSLDFTG